MNIPDIDVAHGVLDLAMKTPGRVSTLKKIISNQIQHSYCSSEFNDQN